MENEQYVWIVYSELESRNQDEEICGNEHVFHGVFTSEEEAKTCAEKKHADIKKVILNVICENA